MTFQFIIPLSGLKRMPEQAQARILHVHTATQKALCPVRKGHFYINNLTPEGKVNFFMAALMSRRKMPIIIMCHTRYVINESTALFWLPYGSHFFAPALLSKFWMIFCC